MIFSWKTLTLKNIKSKRKIKIAGTSEIIENDACAILITQFCFMSTIYCQRQNKQNRIDITVNKYSLNVRREVSAYFVFLQGCEESFEVRSRFYNDGRKL